MDAHDDGGHGAASEHAAPPPLTVFAVCLLLIVIVLLLVLVRARRAVWLLSGLPLTLLTFGAGMLLAYASVLIGAAPSEDSPHGDDADAFSRDHWRNGSSSVLYFFRYRPKTRARAN